MQVIERQREGPAMPGNTGMPNCSAYFAGPRGTGVEIVIEVDAADAAFTRARDAALACGGQVEPCVSHPA